MKKTALAVLACTSISMSLSAYMPYQNYHSYPENNLYRGQDAPYPVYHENNQNGQNTPQNSYFYQDEQYYNQNPSQSQYDYNSSQSQPNYYQSGQHSGQNYQQDDQYLRSQGYQRVNTNILQNRPSKISDASGYSSGYTAYGTQGQSPSSSYSYGSMQNPNSSSSSSFGTQNPSSSTYYNGASSSTNSSIPSYGTQSSTNPSSYGTQPSTYPSTYNTQPSTTQPSNSSYGTQTQSGSKVSYNSAYSQNSAYGTTPGQTTTPRSSYFSTQQQPTSTTNSSYTQDKSSSPADAQLNALIRDKTSRGWLWNSYKDVRLNTNNGVITLEGSVSSKEDQQKLIDEVKKIEGVRGVNNRLTVK